MSYLEYARITWKNFLLKMEGHFDRQARQWEHTRIIAYTIYCTSADKKEDMFEWMPLAHDPTPAQRQRMRKKQDSAEMREAKKLVDLYKKSGYL